MPAHRPTIRALALALAAVPACTDRPLEVTTDSTTATTGVSSHASSTVIPTTTAPTTAPTTTAPTAATTGEPVPTTSTDDSTSETTSAATSTGSPAGPTPCGACGDAEWTLADDLELFAGDDLAQFDCLVDVPSLKLEGDIPADQLAYLGNLRRIGGDGGGLYVQSNHLINDLAAFSCLKEAGYVSMWALPALTDVSGLASLEHAETFGIASTGITALPPAKIQGLYDLTLWDNPALVDLTAAAAWQPSSTGISLNLRSNPVLASLDGLQPLLADGAYDIRIVDMPALTSLQPMATLTGIVNYLEIQNLPALTDLTGLEGVTSGFSVTVDDLPQVTSLAGLGGLQMAAILEIGDCTAQIGMDSLTNLSGLTDLATVGELHVVDNDALTSLAGADALSELFHLQVLGNPTISQAAFDGFVATFAEPPVTACFEDCSCFEGN